MKNDITYEYRVFTNRLIDVESMEVGICTSKVINELKPKNKVDGRFFHTSDTDEWFFCWNGELQKLNLKGNSDVNAALAEVEKLISDAKVAVEDARKTADEAKSAAAEAKDAAKSASSVVENIDSKIEIKADRTEVEAVNSIAAVAQTTANEAKDTAIAAKSAADTVAESIKNKAEQSDVQDLTETVEELSKDIVKKDDISDFVKRGEISSYATQSWVKEQGFITDISNLADKSELPKKVSDLDNDLNFITLADVPEVTVPTKVSDLDNDSNYLNKEKADLLYAAIGSTGSGDGVSKDYVDGELFKKQDKIDGLEDIRSGAAKGATALQAVPAEYVTETELAGKGYITEEVLNTKGYLTEQSLNGYATETFVDENYYTKTEIDNKISDINTLIGEAVNITKTILG